MDAYRKGLSIKAPACEEAEGRRAISEAAMKEFDTQEKEGSRSN